MIAVHRDRALRWIGQTPAIDASAWDAYVRALRDNVAASWARAKAAYFTLKNVRTTLGLPFIVDAAPGEAGATPGMSSAAAWSSVLDQNAVDIMAMVKIAVDAADDVLAGKRKLVYNQKTGDFDIEALPTDLLRVAIAPGPPPFPQLISTATGKPENVQGQIGAAPIFGIAIGVVVIAVVGYFVVEKVTHQIEVVAKQKTLRTLAEKQAELVATGKATPEQAAKMSTAVLDGAKGLAEAEAKGAAAAAAPDKFTDALKTIGIIGVIGLGLILALRLIPERPMPALARKAA